MGINANKKVKRRKDRRSFHISQKIFNEICSNLLMNKSIVADNYAIIIMNIRKR